MAKLCMIERQKKREKLVSKFKEKIKQYKEIINNPIYNFEQKDDARKKLQAVPRNANPTRLRNRCAITGRPRGTNRKSGLSRIKFRELANNGLIPGITKASW